MFTIRKATSTDCELIHKLAWQIFPETYKEILSKEQTEYMMEWMYSIENIRKQMEEEEHVYFIAYEECEAAGYVSIQPLTKDLCTPLLSGGTLWEFPVSRSCKIYKRDTSGTMYAGVKRKPQ